MTFSCHVPLGSSWLWQFPKLSSVLMTWTILKSTGQVYCYIQSYTGICLMFFWWLAWGWAGIGLQKKVHEVNIAHIIWRVQLSTLPITTDVDLHHLADIVFVRFLHCYVILSPFFPYCALWRDLTISGPHLRSGELCSASLRLENIYINYMEFFL